MVYDVIVIGSGPGGYVAAIKASQLGMKTAVIEKELLGGVCLNWGCIPTKTLLKSAQVFDYIKNSESYGIKLQNPEVDFELMIKRSRDVANNMSKGVDFLLKKNNVDVIYGFGKLNRNKNVVVHNSQNNSTQEYRAKNIVIATGAKSRMLQNAPVGSNKIVGYKEILTLKNQPKSITIVGAGAIGVEFAYFYNTIGTNVTLVEYKPYILPLEDEDISKELAKIFEKSGIHLHLNSEVKNINVTEQGCKTTINTHGKTTEVYSDIVLSAIGIEPNISDIGLEDLGVVIEQNRIKVDEYYSTNVHGIYAIGDVIKGPALAHVASAEAILCMEKICGLNPDPLDYNNIPSCTYCQPEIASIGYTEKEAIRQGYNIKVGKFPFSASGKATAVRHKDGFVKVIFDEKYGEWLGAHIIGYNATEMIAEVAVAKKLETTAYEVLKTVHPHPTMSEAIMEAVAVAYNEAVNI